MLVHVTYVMYITRTIPADDEHFEVRLFIVQTNMLIATVKEESRPNFWCWVKGVKHESLNDGSRSSAFSTHAVSPWSTPPPPEVHAKNTSESQAARLFWGAL